MRPAARSVVRYLVIACRVVMLGKALLSLLYALKSLE